MFLFSMETAEIAKQLKEMKTVADLAALLDMIKQCEFGHVRYGISVAMLRHFSSDEIAPKRFRTFHIHKKNGGLREIKAPRRQLEVILTCINTMLKACYKPSDATMGFTAGRSVLSNAQVHVGHNYVFNIDLKDFFPSIPQARVWKRLQLSPFNFSAEIANVLAGICCAFDKSVGRNVLPQGSPTSPLLTNAICDKLDRRMKGVAKRFGLHYSRYADDMTFSSMHNVYQEGGEFRREIERIIVDQGFRMNPNKTRLQKAGTRQEVTGLTVNTIANTSRQYISDLRWLLHTWETKGYAKAYALFYPKYKHEKGYIKKGEPVMENVVGGKLNYLRMIRGANNLAYQKLQTRFNALQQLVFVDAETDKATSYVYVQPYSMADFQQLFHTNVTLSITRIGKLVGKCEIDGRKKTLAISKSTQEFLCPDLENRHIGDSIPFDELSKCFVTLCRNKGKNFWLITKFEPKRSRCLSIQNLNISPADILYLWEKDGLESAVEELTSYIQCANSENSILDWQPIPESKQTVNRGAFNFTKEDIITFFLRNKNVSIAQRKRAMQLMMANIPSQDSPIGANIEELLDIWEKDSLDAAVKVWEELSESKNARKQNNSSDDTGLSFNQETVIHPESPVITCNLDDIPYADDVSETLVIL